MQKRIYGMRFHGYRVREKPAADITDQFRHRRVSCKHPLFCIRILGFLILFSHKVKTRSYPPGACPKFFPRIPYNRLRLLNPIFLSTSYCASFYPPFLSLSGALLLSSLGGFPAAGLWGTKFFVCARPEEARSLRGRRVQS